MMKNKRSAVINFLIKTCEKVSNAILRDFYELEKLQVTKKHLGSFVTNADVKAEKVIMKELTFFKVDSNFMTEEIGEIINFPQEKSRWIVDGIDGTSNFARGNPNFCTSIGLEQEDIYGVRVLTAGVIYCHISRDVYWAEKGKGAYVIDNNFYERKIKVSGREKLEDLVIAASSIPSRYSTAESGIYSKLYQAHSRFRISGSTSIDMAYVASGKFDLCLHDNINLWDVAVGTLLIREAGGIVVDFHKSQDIKHGSSMIAANHQVLDQLL